MSALGGQSYAYSKSAQVLKCPDDSTASTAATTTASALYPVSYSYNYNVAGGSSGASIASMNAPASTIMLSEVKGDVANVTQSPELPSGATITYSSSGDGINVLYYNDAGTNTTGTVQYVSGVPSGYTCPAGTTIPLTDGLTCSGYDVLNSYKGRHAEGSIYAMGDGHSKYLKGGAISAGANAVSSSDAQNVNGTGGFKHVAAGTSNLGNYGVTYSTR